jgi:Nucleoside 2-deoxyribosyltransferase like
MRIIYPPEKIEIKASEKVVFLAGSIENGIAEDWQAALAEQLQVPDLVLLNPRRKVWDATWEQSIDNLLFAEQVAWELEGLELADLVIMNFIPHTLSPISLLEFGLFARSGKMVVCCTHGFWRKGNVDVVCQRYGIKQVAKLADLAREISAIL